MLINKNENLTVLWFDDKIDIEIKNKLEHLHDHCIVCSTISDLLESINRIQNHKLILIVSNLNFFIFPTNRLIVSGQYSCETLSLVHDNENIHSIHIFCSDKQLYQDLLYNKKYPKLINIYTEYTSLFTALEKNIRSILRQLSLFKLSDMNNKTIRDLEQDSADYLWYQLLRDTMQKFKTDTSKQDMYCRSYYQGDGVSLKAVDNFHQSYDSTQTIRWYTKNFFPFKFVNHALRTEDIDALYNLRFFIVDLCKSLKLLFDENYELYQEIWKTFDVYRGLTLPQKDIEQIKQSIGRYVSTNGFLSTSRSREVAKIFAANVLFHIKIDTSLQNIIYADISHLSVMPDEEEVLFDLGTTFQITAVDYNDNMWIVSLVTMANITSLENDFIQTERRAKLIDLDAGDIRADSLFGIFMLELGYYTKSIEFFQNLLKRRTTNWDKYMVLMLLAEAYNRNKQFDLALDHALESYHIGLNLMKEDCDYCVSPYTDLNAIGAIYTNRKQYDIAIQHFEQALVNIDIYNLKIIAELHKNIAIAYFQQENYSYALKHCQQSLEIWNEFLPSNTFHIAQTHHILGEIYYKIENNSLAVGHIQKAFLLMKKIYPENHPDSVRLYERLLHLYYNADQYDLCIEFCEKELQHKLITKLSDYGTIINLYNTLGYSYYHKEDYERAIETYTKSLKLTDEILLDNTELVAHVHHRIGLCHSQVDQYDCALKHYSRSLDLLNDYVADEDIFDEIIALDDDIAFVYEMKTEYPLAIEYYIKALSRIETLDQEKYKVIRARLYSKVGTLYSENEEWSLALQYYKKALGIQEIIVHQDELKIANLNTEVGNCYEEKQKHILAIKYYKKSLEVYKNNVSADNLSKIVEIHKRLGHCFGEIGTKFSFLLFQSFMFFFILFISLYCVEYPGQRILL
ncbi:unnamed protein product [Didymodactylos carnosus]|uniref:NAD(P)(+)--arginine ADP-ribosyltransferase n=1 Tax=Didymodactylos carnosus TaxID=1234261 RepID=A0A815IWM5_9BILA|nr:unnamed protein product [Didymodactylos carnosus]CAF4257750.1 unnamed protein product [Didymodactylos carnosus]